MANADYKPGAFFKSKSVVPSVLTKATKRRAEEQAERDAYRTVDERDGPMSRISGRPTTPGAVDPRMRREHHHIKPRSTHPELKYEPVAKKLS